jgi:mannose-6-phosphate isomerase-like protein (cupin superfamily)
MMPQDETQAIVAAEIVLPGAALDATLAFFAGLGFRLETIFPADAPAVAVLAGHGLRLRLDGDFAGAPGTIRLRCRAPETLAGGRTTLSAPNGTRVELVAAETRLVLPTLRPRFVVSHMADAAAWSAGRAGMEYRDLIPDRLGGRFIASHIAIAEGGAVPDYVHFHKVRFQMIFCRKGRVRVVYEDQGAPFWLEPGDCVVQPPQIRHRVLESTPGLEVVEIGCPALHETWADHAMTLPNPTIDRDRDFSGQRFHRHIASEVAPTPWREAGFARRDTGIGAATAGLAGASVIYPGGATATKTLRHEGEFLFFFVLAGAMRLEAEGHHVLAPGDAVTIPAGMDYALSACSADLALLEVTLPAAI